MPAARTFSSGLLPELIAALRRCGPGDLLAVIGREANIGADLEAWCRFTRNTLINTTIEADRTRWVIRCGEAPAAAVGDRPVGSRLWLYTNFDCNLRCDYCCVRSSPKAPRRALGLERVRRIASEAAELGVGEIFVTGGEPFLLPDIGEILTACAAAAPTTVLTNGMLFAGRRLETLRSLPRDRVTLADQPRQPDAGSGTTAIAGPAHGRAHGEGIERARAEGFRVRLAATVSSDDEAEEFRRFLDAQRIAGRGSGDPPHRAARLRRRGHRARTRRSGAGNHDHGRRRLLASGRRRGRRLAGHLGDLSARRILCRGAPRLRPGKRASAPVGEIFNCA